MKKVLLFVFMIIGITFASGQTGQTKENIIETEMKKLTKLVTVGNENLSFSKNQTAKLEGVFTKKANDIIELRAQELEKGDYVKAHNKIDDKYISKIESVLSTEQKIAYRRNNSKKRSL